MILNEYKIQKRKLRQKRSKLHSFLSYSEENLKRTSKQQKKYI